jgi:hypothetical protein
MYHVSRPGWTGQYCCLKKRCAAVKAEILDGYGQRVVVAWLSRPAIFADLSCGVGDAEIAYARAEAQRLRAELEDWRKLGEAGEVSAISFARAEKGLTAQIAEPEMRPPRQVSRRCCAGGSARKRSPRGVRMAGCVGPSP